MQGLHSAYVMPHVVNCLTSCLSCIRGLLRLDPYYYTVEPPITDSLKYGPPPYTDKQHAHNSQFTIDFTLQIIHFQSLRYGQPPVSGQRIENVPPKDKYIATCRFTVAKLIASESGQRLKPRVKNVRSASTFRQIATQ